MDVFLHDWEGGSAATIASDFGIDPSELDGAKIIVASYTYESYEGDAYVLFERDGGLFEVHAGHCSCYGLSESDYCGDSRSQWEPEAVGDEELLLRLERGYWRDDVAAPISAALAARKALAEARGE